MSIDDQLMMKLTPDSVTAPIGQLVKFTCEYHSSESLRIEFEETLLDEYVEPSRELSSGVNIPGTYNLLKQQPRKVSISTAVETTQSHQWGAEKSLTIRIKPGHKRVSCRVRNENHEVLGILSSMIHPGSSCQYLPNLGASGDLSFHSISRPASCVVSERSRW